MGLNKIKIHTNYKNLTAKFILLTAISAWDRAVEELRKRYKYHLRNMGLNKIKKVGASIARPFSCHEI